MKYIAVLTFLLAGFWPSTTQASVSNDDRNSAMQINASGCNSYTNYNAGDGVMICGNTGYYDVWFRFQANSTNMAISMDPQGIQNPVFAIWDQAGNSIFCGGGLYYANNNFQSGGTYYISVSNMNPSAWMQGNFNLCISNGAVNDNKVNAILLNQKTLWCSELAAYSNVLATQDGSSSDCGTPLSNVWFKFQATTSYIRLDVKTGSTEGTIQYPEIALWDNNNTSVVCADYISGGTGDVYVEKTDLTIGGWYYASVYNGTSGNQGTFTLCVTDQKFPDSKTDAFELTNRNNWCSPLAGHNNIGATQDGTGSSCASTNNNVWYKFQATTSYIKVDVKTGSTEGTITYPEISLWNSSNTELGCASYTSGNGDVTLERLNLTAGQWYYFSVSTEYSSSSEQGTFTLCVTDQKFSDDKADANELTQRDNWCSAPAAYTNVGATNDGPSGSCGAPNNNIWFKFQATTPYIKLDVKTGTGEGTIRYPQIAMWNSGNAQVICTTNNGSEGDISIEKTDLTVGEWYYVSVFNTYFSDQGTFTLCVNDQRFPDNKADAKLLTQKDNWCSSLGMYNNVGATNDGPTSTCGTPISNVWFKFQATTAYIKLNIKTGATEGTIQYPEIALWNSSNVHVSCTNSNGSDGDISLEKLDLTIGEWYYVSVYNTYTGSGDQGTFSLCINDQRFPDNKADAKLLTQKDNWCSALAAYTNVGATNDGSNSTCGAPNSNVWFKFQAATTYIKLGVKPGTGTGTIQYPEIAIWNSADAQVTCGNYTAIRGDVFVEKTDLTVGEWYYVSVYSGQSSSTTYQGTFGLCINDQKFPDNKVDAKELTQINNWCSPLASLTNVGATNDGSNGTCGSPNSNVWYKFQATSAYITVAVKTGGTEGTIKYPQFSLWNSSNQEVLYACNSVSAGDVTAEANNLTVGEWYYLSIYSANSASSNQGTFSLCLSDQPSFNYKEGAIDLVNRANWCSELAKYSNVGATNDGPVSGSCGTPNSNVWFKFVASSSYIKFDAKTSGSEGTMQFLKMVLWNSSNTEVTCTPAMGTNSDISLVASNLVVGQTYYLSVFSEGSGAQFQGTFSLCATECGTLTSYTTTTSSTCNGEATGSVGLTGSELGVNYFINGTQSKAGTGSAISWTGLAAGPYTITGQRGTCPVSTIATNVTVSNYPSMNAYAVSGGGTFCGGATITLANSVNTATYQLKRTEDNALVGAPVTGTGSALTWPNQTVSGTYTVIAQNIANGCTKIMNNTAAITIKPLPVQYTVGGGGSYCQGSAAPSVTLSNSETGVNYQLKINGTNSGSAVAGTGAALTWATQATAGTYTILATGTSTSCTQTMTGSATVILNTLPALYTASGGGSMCASDTGLTITLSGSQSGVNYQLRLNGTNTGSALTGTGAALSWTSQTAAGTYTVMATNATTGCSQQMTGSPAITLKTAPSLFTVGGGGTFCSGSGTSVTLSGSQTGVNYQLKLNGANTGSVVAGTGSALTWASQTASGTYTVTATNVSTSCVLNMTGSAVITVNVLPTLYTVGGGGSYCTGGTGLNVTLSGSQTGVNYQLKINGANSGAALAGSGTTLVWANQTTAGTYTIVATNASTSCSQSMTGNVAISISVLPSIYNVGGGGTQCAAGAGVSVTLSGSQSGVNYQLQLGGVNSGTPVAGTGSTLTWTGQTSTGTYTVQALNATTSCVQAMSGSAAVTINPLPTKYTITGGGSYCTPGLSPAVGLSGSQTGVNYQLQLNGSNSGSSVAGTGSSLQWTGLANGTYTVVATIASTSCAQPMTGSIAISSTPKPTDFALSGGGSYCIGGTGVSVTLQNSEAGVTYELIIAGVSSGTKAGTGSPLVWTNQTTAGTSAAITATNASTGCTATYSYPVAIVANPLPTLFVTTGGGTYCSGTAIPDITLSGSQTGVNYQLKRDGTNVGAPLAGTGSVLAWTNQPASTNYTIVATNSVTNCVANMNGSASIVLTVTPQAFNVSGSGEVCLNKEMPIGLSGSETGVTYQLQFNNNDVQTLQSGTGNALTWIVKGQEGVYTVNASRQGCTALMNSSAQTDTLPLPKPFQFTGGGAVYPGSPAARFRLNGSQAGVNYYLQRNGVNVSPVVAGNGKDLHWTDQSVPGAYQVKAVNTITLCEDFMTGVAYLTNQRMPEEMKLTRDGALPPAAVERQTLLSSVQINQPTDVFLAPPCLEGNYYVGFQLYYDLGDKQTTNLWTSQLSLTVLHGEDSVLTLPLQLNMKDQTFVATAFYDSLISCGDDYRFTINEKRNLGNVPENNIYLKVLLYRKDVVPFDPAVGLLLNCSNNGKETTLGWNYGGKSSSEFDVEWVFIAEEENFTGTTAEQAFQYKEPVRVTVAARDYKHLVYYPKGEIWYRVRAVGYNPQYPGHRIQGIWSYSPCEKIVVNNPEINRNWQEQTVFAEDGKYKKVVHYYDGSMRERQAQTNLSTEEITLVGESLYDFEGRKSVDILPVPATDNTLTFKANFNTFASSSDPIISANTSASRHKYHFDNRRRENTPLSTLSGTGRYYSAANVNNSVHKNYTPDAAGFAYSQTEYTNDGTGRISRQSGVGEIFRADGSHTTRTFYGSAAPAELYRLFGTNAGDATHYKKTMVVDANDQVSVTYHDQEGRTIATALAGDKPANVDSLKSYRLLELTPITVSLNNKNEQDNGAWVVNHSILNAVPNTPYTFKYNLAALASQVEAMGCQNCVFDLELTLTDPEGTPISLAAVAGNQSTDTLRYLRSGITATNCTDSLKVNNINFTVSLKSAGDYTLSKTLTPRELTFEQMQAIVEQNTEVQQEIQQIRNSYASDPSQCKLCDENSPEAEQAIQEAMQEVADQDCENIYQQIIADLKSAHSTDPEYEPTDPEIKAQAGYCQYELCIKDKASDVFDKQLSRFKGWSEAVAAGYANILSLDPFFNNPALSGTSRKTDMQNMLNDVTVGTVMYDNNGDGVPDGTTTYHGAIAQVTDPANTAYYIDNNGNSSASGHHLMYAGLEMQRAQWGETEYQNQLNQQRWTLYRNFYAEAKRRIKLSAYQSCAAATAQLGKQDELPKTPEEAEAWAAQQDVTLVNEASTADLRSSLYSIRTACNSTFSTADSTAISNHLQTYFNSNKKNFFRVIIKTDVNTNPELLAIKAILSHYSCSLDSVAVDDPLNCVQSTTISLPGWVSAQEAPEESNTTGTNQTMALRVMNTQQGDLISLDDANEVTENSIPTGSMQQVEIAREQLSDTTYLPNPLVHEFLDNQLSKMQDSILDRRLNEQLQSVTSQYQQGTPRKNARSANQQVTALTSQLLIPQNEYNALVTLYNSTNGPDWQDNTGWSGGVINGTPDVAGWYGLTAVTLEDGQNHVYLLNLSNNNLIGTVPADIGNLTRLVSLSFGSSSSITNNLSFNISVLSPLTKLTLLQLGYISSAGITGDFSALSGMTEMSYLNITNTGITGNLSAFSSMTKMTNLLINSPNITGNIASLGGLKQLTYLSVIGNNQVNKISGDVSVLGGLTKLSQVQIYNMDLSGSIGSFTNLTELAYFSAVNIGLVTGDIASFSSSKLVSLDIHNMALTGGLSAFASKNKLTSLNLDNCGSISGDLSALAPLTNLQTLGIFPSATSSITGDLSVFSGKANLMWLQIYNSVLTGSLSSLGNNLRVIQLVKCSLSETVPTASRFPYLSTLSLSENNFTFSDLLLARSTFPGLAYTPQNEIDVTKTVTRTVGEPVTFSTTIDTNLSPASIYTWYKNDMQVQSSNLPSLTLNNLTMADNGARIYYSIKNSGAPLLTLFSRTQTLVVNKASQSITFAPLLDRKVGDPNFQLTATASSGLPVTYTSSNPAVATVSGNTVTIVGVGITTITASQPGNGNFSPAQDVAQPFRVRPENRVYDICLAYDLNNPTLQQFNYTVDWNALVQQCMANEAKADSILTQVAIDKLMEQRVSSYFTKYSTQCLQKVTEKLSYTYVSKEYHYTLYYYDQGGNLAQTVPPEGVKFLASNSVDSLVNQLINGSRLPQHTLVTKYQYNSLNQLVMQNTPDAGTSQFWYNHKGQLRLSRNAQQALDSKYSYTSYDEQGRITDVGEMNNATFNEPVINDSIASSRFPMAGVYSLSDITRTHYDFADTTFENQFTQQYLRSRVAWVEIIDKNATDTTKTYYSYDVHGNVKSLVQALPGLKPKRTDYVYDLVSGKVNYVLYQFNEHDQFVHRYVYDADNRITDVFTSSDRFIWNKEANYDYYLHGPLARTELGQYRVQGLDYYYTLQGWIKGVNTPYAGDPGNDGVGNSRVGKDVFAYNLGYFNEDYTPINNSVVVAGNRDKLWGRALENIQHTGLYNGNISWMTTDLAKLGGEQHDRTKGMQAMLYRYDQLHRITMSRSLTSYSETNGFAARATTAAYDENYTYDANGNILKLKRNDKVGAVKDDFTYTYYANTNKLQKHKTTGGTYTYDAIGNLITDGNEGVVIAWTPYGKVRTVQKGDSVTTSYRYDASGNRIEQKVVKADTSYVTRYLRDASGNVMTIYRDTTLHEQPIYGSARVGQYKGGIPEGYRTLGARNFELSNHLGNVLAVITDNAGMKADSVWATVMSTSDYYPFGLDMDGRNYSDTTENVYRYGFNGKEKDNMGASVYDYGFRIYNPEIAKFLSVDPLTKQYPWYTPYQFAGNKPIWAIDLDGLEEAVILGSEKQVTLVTQFNSKIEEGDANWAVFKFNDLKTAKIDLQNHKNLGNKINVLLIQAHAGAGEISLYPGPDGKLENEGVLIGTYVRNDDQTISGYQIGWYLGEIKTISEIKNSRKRERMLSELKMNQEVQKIDQLLGVVNEIEDGGTLVLNGCHVFSEKEGLEFSENIRALTGKEINVIGAKDFVKDAYKDDQIFGGGLIVPEGGVTEGYMKNSENTQNDLRLNGTTDKPAIELTPIKKK